MEDRERARRMLLLDKSERLLAINTDILESQKELKGNPLEAKIIDSIISAQDVVRSIVQVVREELK